jgi:hypothetical protein
MNPCLFCGHDTNAEVSAFHGSVSTVCKSTWENRTNCKNDWQNFKTRITKYKASKYPQVQALAYRAEKEVFENSQPAIHWNTQLMAIRKVQKKLPTVEVVQQ